MKQLAKNTLLSQSAIVLKQKLSVVFVSDADIKEHVKQIEKAVQGKEPRFVLRALRALPSTSRRLNPNVLHKAVSGYFTSNAASKEFLLGFLDEVPNPHLSVPYSGHY